MKVIELPWGHSLRLDALKKALPQVKFGDADEEPVALLYPDVENMSARPPSPVRCLVDSGASVTYLDAGRAKHFGVSPKRFDLEAHPELYAHPKVHRLTPAPHVPVVAGIEVMVRVRIGDVFGMAQSSQLLLPVVFRKGLAHEAFPDVIGMRGLTEALGVAFAPTHPELSGQPPHKMSTWLCEPPHALSAHFVTTRARSRSE